MSDRLEFYKSIYVPLLKDYSRRLLSRLEADAYDLIPQNFIPEWGVDYFKSDLRIAFVGLETITGVILAILLIFISVEKTVGRKQAIIKARQGAEATEEPTPLTEKEEAAWKKEQARGEKFYEKIQKKLAGK